jgi:hypothetical protein
MEDLSRYPDWTLQVTNLSGTVVKIRDYHGPMKSI